MCGLNRLLFLAIFLFLSVAVYASKTDKLKYQCIQDDYEFQGHQMVLHLTDHKQYQVYFFRNLSDQAIWLNRPLLHSANAGWSSELTSGHWSALLIENGPVVFDCAVMKANYQLQAVSCEEVLSICRLPQVHLKSKNAKGSYWLAEDIADENSLLEKIKKSGIDWK